MFNALSHRRTATLFLACVATVSSIAPAYAAGDKPISVTMPASVFKDDTTRVCMPRTVLGRKANKALPATICETRAEWSARGVNIVTK